MTETRTDWRDLVDAALAARRRGDYDTADEYARQAYATARRLSQPQFRRARIADVAAALADVSGDVIDAESVDALMPPVDWSSMRPVRY